jgi:hypothetical protein
MLICWSSVKVLIFAPNEKTFINTVAVHEAKAYKHICS